MCYDNGSRPAGEALAVLRPSPSADQDGIDPVLQNAQLSLLFSNPRPSKQQGGSGHTQYQFWSKQGTIALGTNCQIRIQLSPPFSFASHGSLNILSRDYIQKPIPVLSWHVADTCTLPVIQVTCRCHEMVLKAEFFTKRNWKHAQGSLMDRP